MKKTKLFILFVAGIMNLMPLVCSCEGQDDGTTCASLQKASDKAKEVIAEALPDAKLAEINGIEIAADGSLTAYGEWTFYYFREIGNDYTFQAVSIQPNCKERHWNPGGSITFTEIPCLTNSQDWISMADQIMNENQRSFSSRTMQVFADEDDIFPGADIITYVYFYNDPDGEHTAYIVLDAETNAILQVELNP